MEESNKTMCKTCRIIKTRTLDDKFPNRKDKRWIDEHMKLWNGQNCPSCHAEKMKHHVKKVRAVKV